MNRVRAAAAKNTKNAAVPMLENRNTFVNFELLIEE